MNMQNEPIGQIEYPAVNGDLNGAACAGWQESFAQNGFLILRDFFHPAHALSPLIDQITWLGKRMAGPDFDFLDAAAIETLDLRQRGTLYRSMRYLPALAELAASAQVLSLSRELGIVFPLLMHSFNIRMDTPNRDEFLFHWHQDNTYLLGSRNALTFWIPLVQVDRRHGSIEVVPGSHREGLFPVTYTGEKSVEANTALSPADMRLVNEPEEPGTMVEAKPGDLVVFSQYLLHASTPNRSSQTRWSVQVRISDGDEQGFLDAGLPMGDGTNIYFNDYLGKPTQS